MSVITESRHEKHFSPVKALHENSRSLTLEQFLNEWVYLYTNESGTAECFVNKLSSLRCLYILQETGAFLNFISKLILKGFI